MTDTMTAAAPQSPPVVRRSAFRHVRSFFALLSRDIFVMGRELASLLAQTLIQPFFMLLVLGKVLTEVGYVHADYLPVLLPGIIGLTAFLGALQNTTLGLVFDFSWTREIDDRLLAPAPTAVVALAKMAFGALRGLLSAVVMTPIGFLTLGVPWWSVGAILVSLVLVVIGACGGAALGMLLGTSVEPSHISIAFAIVVTPLTFTGSTQFPWPLLTEMRWFQVLCALNPLTYVSEALRGVTAPSVPHLAVWIDVLVMLATVVGFGALGIRGFRRRSLR